MSNTKSGLLQLPPELRNRIYEVVFADSHAQLSRSRKYFSSCRPYQPQSLGILLACHQTYNEAVGIFYNLTTFYLNHADTLVAFLRFTLPAHATSVDRVRFDTVKKSGSGLTTAMIAEDAQDDLFRARFALEQASCPVPKSMEASIVDFSRPSRNILWTSTPCKTFLNVYSQFTDEEKDEGNDDLVAHLNSFVLKGHVKEHHCWIDWNDNWQRCYCPRKHEVGGQNTTA